MAVIDPGGTCALICAAAGAGCSSTIPTAATPIARFTLEVTIRVSISGLRAHFPYNPWLT
jgi:hypothetical protein